MASKISRLSKAIAIAMLGLSLSGGNMPAVHASDADAELAALEAELAALESELAQEKGTIKEEKTKLKNEPNKLALSGDARLKYTHTNVGANWYLRGRVALKHDINEKVSVNARWVLASDNPMGLSGNTAHRFNTYSQVNYENKYVPASKVYPDSSATDGNWVSEANMQIKKFLGADKFTLGRFGQSFGATHLMGDEDAFGGIDGAKFDWSGQAGALTVGYAKFGASQQYPEINTYQALNPSAGLKYVGGSYQRKPIEQALFVNGQLKLGPAVTLHGMWIKEMNNGKSNTLATGSSYTPYFFDNPNDHDIRGIGITAQITPNLRLVGDYMINANDFSTSVGVGAEDAKAAAKKFGVYKYERQKAEYISLRYKEAKWGDKGSFGINLDWRNIDPSARLCAYATAANDYHIMQDTLFSPISMADDLLAENGVKGPVLGFHYMISKNMKLSVLQTFANSVSSYNLSLTNKKSGGKNHYWSYIDKVNNKADNMTVISLMAKF